MDQITPRRRFERRREVSALLRSSDLSYFVSDFLFLIVFLFEWRWSHEGDGVGVVEDGYSGVEVCVTPMRTKIIIWVTRTQNILGEKGRRNLVSVAVLRSLEHLGCGGFDPQCQCMGEIRGEEPWRSMSTQLRTMTGAGTSRIVFKWIVISILLPVSIAGLVTLIIKLVPGHNSYLCGVASLSEIGGNIFYSVLNWSVRERALRSV